MAAAPYTGGGSTAGPMPDCYGLTVAACESSITEARPNASFIITTASSPDPNVADGLVSATTPSAATDPTPTSDTIYENPDDGNPQGCTSRTDDPHWSDTGATVLSKGWVTCDYAGDADVTMTLWTCTSQPSPDQIALEDDDWGCSIAATTYVILTVYPSVERGPIYVPLSSQVSGDNYFIAETQMPNADTSWSTNAPYVEP